MRAFWPLVICGIVLFAVSVLTLNLFEGGALKSHPWYRRLLELAPFAYVLICWAIFSLAARHDRRVDAALKASAVAASAPAVVLEVRDRGIELGVNPVLTVRIRVTPTDAEPFEGEVAFLPSRLDMGLVRKGTTLLVRYDPDHQRRIAVEAITSAAIP